MALLQLLHAAPLKMMKNISPNKRKRKNYFRHLEKQSRTDKTEAQLYFENPSKSLDQLDHYPSIKKIYV